MVGRDGLVHARLDGRQVVRRQRPRQVEVVVEAVGDGRPDAQLRAREQVHHRLGHDVRGRVAHRDRAGCPRSRRAAPRPTRAWAPRTPALLRLICRCWSAGCLVDRHWSHLRRIKRPLVHRSSFDRTRGSRPPAVPPAFAGCDCSQPALLWTALTGGARTGSPVAHGWCALRPIDRPGFQPLTRAL